MKILHLLCSGILVSNCIISLPVKAQIAIDGTTNTILDSNGNSIIINEGDRAGNNLFHSFEQFSIPTGSEAFFDNANDIVNIFSRVTGGDISNIDGLIRANGDANLFLINPAGIIFGEGASLDIGGSFFASSAESIVFSDNIEFSTADSSNEPLLTINQPVGLSLGNNSGDIAVNGSNLQVNSGETLALVGGNVTLTGGQIFAPGSRIELGSVGENSLVNLTSANFEWLLDYERVSIFQNIRLSDSTNIAVNGDGNGSITVNANNIELISGSNLQAGIDSDFQLSNIQAGDITLNANGVVSIDRGRIANESQEGGVGNTGDINITAQTINLKNNAAVSANTFGQGNTGNITLNARDEISYDGAGTFVDSFISASVFGTGNGSKITLSAAKIFLFNKASIASHSFGEGNAGNIEISATDSSVMNTSSSIGSQVFAGSTGDGGLITINASKVSLLTGSTIVAHTFATGNAGRIEIKANNILLDGVDENGASSGLGSAAFDLESGRGGAITIDTNSLNVTNGATLFVSSFGKEDAGRVTIIATGAVAFDGIGENGFSSNAFSTVEAESAGNGREINIKADSLSVVNGAVIGASTSGQGEGGNINIDVNTLQIQNGGQILTTSRGSGDAGDISLDVTESTTIEGIDENFPERLARIGRPIVRNEGSASGLFTNADIDSRGSGGEIILTTGNLFLSDGALINATNQGNSSIGKTGGNIRLQIANNLTLQNNSTISARTLENSDGGNLTINADTIVAFPSQNNDIIANAERGTGGNIDITTSAIFGLEERSSTPANLTNDIDASSEFGLDGNISINELEVNPAESLEELPTEVINVAALVAQNLCQQGQGSEFVVTGKGGIASSPSQTRDGNVGLVGLVEPVVEDDADRGVSRNTRTEVEKEIVEAQGWIISDRGKIELVAHQTNSNFLSQLKETRFCP